tara:strand:- start:36397 stop:38814 length:2418 start_codon:yes stop_codon:yes gene_type:complete
MFRYIFSLLLIGIAFSTSAQSLSGRLVDKNKEAIPFASVYFKGSTVGTSTNIDGFFELPDNSKYSTLIFSAVGFGKKEVAKTSFTSSEKEIVLDDQSISLKTVEVKKRKRDRAFYIMKNAIKRRGYFNELVKQYNADIYMKGSLYITEIPKFMLALADSADRPDSSDLGLMFLTESVSKLEYQAPNSYKEEMVASKVSGTMTGLEGFSWNRARSVMINLYDNNIDLMVGGRGFISPLSSSAFIYYNFKYEGYFKEGDFLINKIKVTPKRKTDPVFTGYLYIVEDEWNIHSADLKLTKSTNVEYVDSVYFKQNFSLVNDTIFMPISVNLDIHYTILGIKARYYALGQMSEYDLTKGLSDTKQTKLEFEVKQEAIDKTDNYWETERPVILSKDEKVNYFKGDSIQNKLNDPAYLDSLDKISNKFKFVEGTLLGYTYYNRKDSVTITAPALLNSVQYTSVDGAIIQLEPTYNKQYKNGFTRVSPKLRYGFASKQFDGSVLFEKQYNKENYRTVQAEVGTNTLQINRNEPIARDFNSYYNLFRDRNYGQFYRESIITRAAISQEIANGLKGQFTLNFTQRQNLQNTINKTVPSIDSTTNFTPNLQAVNNHQNLFFVGMNFSYQPGNRYEIYPNQKRNLGSKWPRFNGRIKFAPDYFTQLSISASKRFDLSLLGSTSTYVNVGTFLGNKNIDFVDREHFMGNQTKFSSGRFTSFNIMPYYLYSSASQYAHAAVEHNFNGWIFNKLPLLRRTQLQTVVAVKALSTDNNPLYSEFSVGIGNIFKIFRLDVVSSNVDGTFSDPSLLIGISLLN